MLSLITKGMICIGGDITVINRVVLPLNLQIKEQESLNLQVEVTPQINLNANDIIDKNINLKITEKNINIKKPDSNINIDL